MKNKQKEMEIHGKSEEQQMKNKIRFKYLKTKHS